MTFSAPVDGWVTITIDHNPGWRFDPVCNNVAAQDYAAPTAGVAAPDSFAHQACFGGPADSILVPLSNYYAVHANGKRQGGF